MSAADVFRAVFGREPEGLWAAPGRVNIIGEHTDHSDGYVLPIALRHRVIAAAARREDGLLVVHSAQRPGERQARALAELAPGSVDGWAAYPLGVAWALAQTPLSQAPAPAPAPAQARARARAGNGLGGVDLVIDGDVPQGAGLSSSAAVECATALAFNDLFDLGASRAELARLARRAENDFVGVPCGVLDQAASLLATEGHALLIDTRDLAAELIPFDVAAAGLALLLIDTRTPHQLVDGQYADRRDACRRAARALGVPALRDATPDDVARLADPLPRRRARHVVTENARVLAAAALLRRGEIRGLGPLLTASHASLRDDFEVTVAQLDVAVEVALATGALGARMVGGGFGGCVLALVEEPDVDAVAAAVAAEFARRGFTAPAPMRVVPSAGACRLG